MLYCTFSISSRVNNVFCPPGWFRYRLTYIYVEAPGLPGVGENNVLWVGEQSGDGPAPTPAPAPAPAARHTCAPAPGARHSWTTPGARHSWTAPGARHTCAPAPHTHKHTHSTTHMRAHTRMCTHTHTRTRTAWGKCPPGFVREWLKYFF
jgi:hypothetical protein